MQMNIGIMGLRPRQIDDVRRRELKGLAISYFDEKSYDPDQIEAFCRKSDRVYVLPAHVPRAVPKMVPVEKRGVVLGSVSSLLRELEQLSLKTIPTPAPVIEKSRVNNFSAPVTDVPKGWHGPLTSNQSPSAAKPVAPVVLLDSKIKYVFNEKLEVMPCGPNGVQNYKILGAVQLGDIVRFERPAKISARLWKSRINCARTYYKAKLGIEFEAHFFGNMVDLLATNVPRPGSVIEAPEVMQEIEATDPLYGRGSADGDQVTGNVVSTQPDVERPSVAEAVEEKVVYNALQRSFWKRAYLACLTFGNTPIEAEAKADAALRAHDLRFG